MTTKSGVFLATMTFIVSSPVVLAEEAHHAQEPPAQETQAENTAMGTAQGGMMGSGMMPGRMMQGQQMSGEQQQETDESSAMSRGVAGQPRERHPGERVCETESAVALIKIQ